MGLKHRKTYPDGIAVMLALGALVLVLCAWPTPAAAAPPGDAASIAPGAANLLLTPNLSLLSDPDGQMTFDQAASPAMRERYRPVFDRILHLGIGHAKYWVQVNIAWPDPQRPGLAGQPPRRWLLQVTQVHLSLLDIYLPVRRDGRLSYRQVRAGVNQPPDALRVPFRTPVISFPADLAADAPIYIHFGGVNTANLELWLRSPLDFARLSDDEGLFFGAIFGVMLAMFIYNGFIGLTLRERNYLLYVIYMGSLLLFYPFLYGQAQKWGLTPPAWNTSLAWMAEALVFFWAAMFARSFLRTKSTAPLLDLVIKLLAVGGLAPAVCVALGLHLAASWIGHVMGMAGPVVLLTAGLISWRRGFRPARYFVAAWMALLMATVLIALKGFALLPQSLDIIRLLPVGIAAECLLLSLALADLIRTLRRERETALENEQRYRRLSFVDELTGLFNKRHLLSRLEKEVERAHTRGTPLSLLLLDLDEFKRFNDTFGHPAGDQLLRSLADLVRKSVRDGDSACRYGGEEFLVIMPGVKASEAARVGERIRAAVAAMPNGAGTGPGARVTVSLGVAQLKPGENWPELLERADQALYRAKGLGKDRVSVAA